MDFLLVGFHLKLSKKKIKIYYIYREIMDCCRRALEEESAELTKRYWIVVQLSEGAQRMLVLCEFHKCEAL